MLYTVSHWAFGPSRLLEKVTPRAREEILALLMIGRISMCFGLSEPGSGSDAAALKTRAAPDGNGWRISGRTIWTSNSPIADYCIIFAITDPERAAKRRGGISAFWSQPTRRALRFSALLSCLAISVVMRRS